MNCEMFRNHLDALIDAQIDPTLRNEMEAHAAACPECAKELEIALLLQDTMRGMDDDIAVPLDAQAAWRKAVRSERSKKRTSLILKIASAAAAVFVLFFAGVHFLKPSTASLPVTSVVQMDSASVSEEAEVLRLTLSVEDMAQAKQQVEELCAEYSASCEPNASDTYKILLSGDMAEDFIAAVSALGEESLTGSVDAQAESVAIYIGFKSQVS